MAQPDQEAGIYGIGAVARMLGVEPATLRNWEDRYGIVEPQRSNGGHRLFSRSDVERLRFVADQIEAGASAVEAHRLLESFLREGRPLSGGSPAIERPTVVILLAERDPLAAELTEFFLRTEGYDVVISSDAADASEYCRQRRPQLAIVDLLLPGGDALLLCQTLKAEGVGAVVAVSTLNTFEPAISAGADAFLRKPLDPLRLVSTVKDLLGTSALRSSSQVVRG